MELIICSDETRQQPLSQFAVIRLEGEYGSVRVSSERALGVNESVCQGRVVDHAPTDLQNGPTNGGVVSTRSAKQTPIPCVSWIKTKRDGALENTSLAWLEQQNQEMHLGWDWRPRCATYRRNYPE